jgi:hypothetical protein
MATKPSISEIQHAPETDGTPLDPESALMRHRCSLLLQQIPDSGLYELYECMERIRDFYAAESSQVAPRASIEEVSAVLGETYVRPEFHLDVE